jgi:hypothetical protein
VPIVRFCSLDIDLPACDTGLAPLPPGGQEAQGYNDLVERSKTGVYQFDRLLTIVLAIDPSWLNPDRAIQAFDSVSRIHSDQIPLGVTNCSVFRRLRC